MRSSGRRFAVLVVGALLTLALAQGASAASTVGSGHDGPVSTMRVFGGHGGKSGRHDWILIQNVRPSYRCFFMRRTYASLNGQRSSLNPRSTSTSPDRRARSTTSGTLSS